MVTRWGLPGASDPWKGPPLETDGRPPLRRPVTATAGVLLRAQVRPERPAFVLDLMNGLADRYPLGTIWPHERLCNDISCAVARDNHLLYADDDHLSVFGAQSIAGLFTPIFKEGPVVFQQH